MISNKQIETFNKDTNNRIEDIKKKTLRARDKMKDLCIEYFTTHEENVLEIKTKVNGVIKSFEDWKMYVMNPQTINEARIKTLDVKWDDIEKQVHNNFATIYNIVKKLLFSLQQQMVQSKELAPIFRTPNQKIPDDSSRDLDSKSTYSKGGGKRPDTGKI